jgi:hypothetical protein
VRYWIRKMAYKITKLCDSDLHVWWRLFE